MELSAGLSGDKHAVEFKRMGYRFRRGCILESTEAEYERGQKAVRYVYLR